MDRLTFQEALKNSEARILILGNGFSMDWNLQVFGYSSLKEKARSFQSEIDAVFKSLDTNDFEEVIRAFESAAMVCKAFKIKNNFKDHAGTVRNALIEVIGNTHPDHPDLIDENEFESCVRFLTHFESVYTLNYDMLLYWVLMRDLFREGASPKLKTLPDGFAYNNQDFLNWGGSAIKVHYLHGALHLFEETDVVKLNYRKSKWSLKKQFTKLINEQKRYPLFVSEGDSKGKLRRIRNSGYLTRCYNSLQNIGAKKTKTSLFTFGVSFSENDRHISEAIAKNNCQQLFVGVFGSPASKGNKMLIKEVELIKQRRALNAKSLPLETFYFDSASAKVWR